MSVAYAYTVTLQLKLYKDPPEEQYDTTYSKLRDLLRSMTNYYVIVAEVTKSYNIHYHGFIWFGNTVHNCMKKFHDKFRKDTMFGFVNIKQCDNDEKWLYYIMKDLKNFYEEIGRRPIVDDTMEKITIEDKMLYGTTW
jgi:hypothetical protein